MEFRDLAIKILSATTLEDKLTTPNDLTDHNPGPSLIWDTPSRPVGMGFKRHSKKERLPSFFEHSSQDNRAVCLHRFAGHELLAVEIMAFALLAFPEAPKNFRKGLLNTLIEEQEHVNLYIQRLEKMGVKFGDLPLYRHFWSYTPYITSPEKYLTIMSLTFEMANLDFAPHYGMSFLKNGDEESSLLMERILKDEIAHVSFGMSWFKKMKDPSLSEWDAWVKNLPAITTPKRARGFIYQEEYRKKAGVPKDWIDNLRA